MHQDDRLGLILVTGLNGVQKVEVLLGGDPVPFIRNLVRVIAKRPLVPQVADALHQDIVAGGLIKGQVEFPFQRPAAKHTFTDICFSAAGAKISDPLKSLPPKKSQVLSVWRGPASLSKNPCFQQAKAGVLL